MGRPSPTSMPRAGHAALIRARTSRGEGRRASRASGRWGAASQAVAAAPGWGWECPARVGEAHRSWAGGVAWAASALGRARRGRGAGRRQRERSGPRGEMEGDSAQEK